MLAESMPKIKFSGVAITDVTPQEGGLLTSHSTANQHFFLPSLDGALKAEMSLACWHQVDIVPRDDSEFNRLLMASIMVVEI